MEGERTNGQPEGVEWCDTRARQEGRRAIAAGWRERDVSVLAAKQRGVIGRAQLLALGIGDGAVAHALESGRLTALHRGVYAIAPRPALPPLALEQAAVLACGARTALSHQTAARIWDLPVAPPAEVHVIAVGHQRGRRAPGIHLHRVAGLARGDVRRYRRLPVTAPARTLLDLASALSQRDLEAAFDEAIARRIVSRTAMQEALARYPRRSGCVVLQELVEARTISRSSGEKELAKLICRAGLPMPETNAGFGRFEVDFLWREQRVAVELDSYLHHSSRAALERDHAKDVALQAAGFAVVRISGRQLAHAPEWVLAQIAGALARGGLRPG